MILSYTLILPMSQLQTQQLMTSQIRSHIEYLIHTNSIIVLILYSNLLRNVAVLAIFNTIYWWFLIVAYFFGPPCRHRYENGVENFRYHAVLVSYIFIPPAKGSRTRKERLFIGSMDSGRLRERFIWQLIGDGNVLAKLIRSQKRGWQNCI